MYIRETEVERMPTLPHDRSHFCPPPFLPATTLTGAECEVFEILFTDPSYMASYDLCRNTLSSSKPVLCHPFVVCCSRIA